MPKYPWDTRPQCIAEQVWNVYTWANRKTAFKCSLQKHTKTRFVSKNMLWHPSSTHALNPCLICWSQTSSPPIPHKKIQSAFLVSHWMCSFCWQRYQAHQSWITPRCGIKFNVSDQPHVWIFHLGFILQTMAHKSIWPSCFSQVTIHPTNNEPIEGGIPRVLLFLLALQWVTRDFQFSWSTPFGRHSVQKCQLEPGPPEFSQLRRAQGGDTAFGKVQPEPQVCQHPLLQWWVRTK